MATKKARRLEPIKTHIWDSSGQLRSMGKMFGGAAIVFFRDGHVHYEREDKDLAEAMCKTFNEFVERLKSKTK